MRTRKEVCLEVNSTEYVIQRRGKRKKKRKRIKNHYFSIECEKCTFNIIHGRMLGKLLPFRNKDTNIISLIDLKTTTSCVRKSVTEEQEKNNKRKHIYQISRCL